MVWWCSKPIHGHLHKWMLRYLRYKVEVCAGGWQGSIRSKRKKRKPKKEKQAEKKMHKRSHFWFTVSQPSLSSRQIGGLTQSFRLLSSQFLLTILNKHCVGVRSRPCPTWSDKFPPSGRIRFLGPRRCRFPPAVWGSTACQEPKTETARTQKQEWMGLHANHASDLFSCFPSGHSLETLSGCSDRLSGF